MYALLWHLDFEKECQNTWAYFSLQLQIQTKQQQQKQSLRFKLQCTKHATECLCWWENTRSFSSRQYDQQLFFFMENNKIFHENDNLSIRWKPVHLTPYAWSAVASVECCCFYFFSFQITFIYCCDVENSFLYDKLFICKFNDVWSSCCFSCKCRMNQFLD